MQLISVLNGSRLRIAMKPTIGAFHLGASRLSTVSARLTRRGSRLFGARCDAIMRGASVFFGDAICQSIEPIYHARADATKRAALLSFDGLRRLGIVFPTPVMRRASDFRPSSG